MLSLRTAVLVCSAAFCEIGLVALIWTADGDSKGLSCRESHFNFGEQTAGGSLDHTFVVKNDSPREALILGVQTDCSCTKVEIANCQYPIRVAPGESVDVHLHFKIREVPGAQRSLIVVKTSDPSRSVIPLTVHGVALN